MKRLIHKLAHIFGWNTGKVETWFQHGRLMVGFRCNGCGKLSGIHIAHQFKRFEDSPK